MEADLSCNELVTDNKENIPPNSSSLEEIFLQDCKLVGSNGGRKFKRKFKRPLTDITNSLVIVGQSDLGLHSSAALNCRKRKASEAASASPHHIDIDWKHKNSSKMLRKGFR